MSHPLMPIATAVWLVEKTTLSFRQISEFCNLHEMEVQSIADGEIAFNIVGQDPILNGQLTNEMIAECEKDESKNLELIQPIILEQNKKSKTKKYIPIAKRRDKPDAIAWLLKHHPELPDNKIVKLIGTTKKTIEAIRDRTHSNIKEIQPRDPVFLELCTQTELDNVIALSEKAKDVKIAK